MKKIYLEFLTELYYSLERLNISNWAEWMKRSVDKFNSDENVSYFLSAYGGMGSFSDLFIDDEVTEELRNIAYTCASSFQNKEETELKDILLKEKNTISENISYCENNQSNKYFASQLPKYINKLDYINELLEQYVEGNLHAITTNYLNNLNQESTQTLKF